MLDCTDSDPFAELRVEVARQEEHRYMMQQMIGRSLLPGETVHHRNGIRHDNRPENLELWTKAHPPGQRVTDLVKWAKEILTLYQSQIDTGEIR